MEKFIKEVSEKYDNSDFTILKYEGRTKPCEIKCLKCGNIFLLDRANRLLDKTRKNICPNCLIKKKPSQQQISVEYQHKFDYWYEKIGSRKYEIIKGYEYFSVPVELKCKNCGAITSRYVENLLKKPECLSCELKCSVKKTDECFKKEVYSLVQDEYIFLEPYKGANQKIKVRHSCGFIYYTSPHNFLSRERRCPKCSQISSKGEKAIEKTLLELKIPFEKEKRFDELNRCPFDFYLPIQKVFIEYQGIQHYEPVEFFGGEDALKKQKETDLKKKKFAIENGNFLEISYLEYQDIPKILKNFLSKFNDYPLGGVGSSESKRKRSF